MMKRIRTYTAGAAAILGSALIAGSALAAEDVIVISNEPIPYAHDERFAPRPMADVDIVYPRDGGPALIVNPNFDQRSAFDRPAAGRELARRNEDAS